MYAGAGQEGLVRVKICGILMRDCTISGEVASIEKSTQTNDHEVCMVRFHRFHKQLNGIGDERNMKSGGDVLNQIEASGLLSTKMLSPFLMKKAADLQISSFSLYLWISRIPTGNPRAAEDNVLSKTAPP